MNVDRLRDMMHDASNYDALLERIDDADVVCIGEASHGTHEFYRERAKITQRLIDERGFNAVAVEADWPDAYRVNRCVRAESDDEDAEQALEGFKSRFPTWMWRNADVLDFIEAQTYGYAAAFGIAESCQDEVVKQLTELQRRRAGERRVVLHRAERASSRMTRSITGRCSTDGFRHGTCATGTWPRRSTRWSSTSAASAAPESSSGNITPTSATPDSLKWAGRAS